MAEQNRRNVCSQHGGKQRHTPEAEAELTWSTGALSKAEERQGNIRRKGYHKWKHKWKEKTKNYSGKGKEKKISEQHHNYLLDLFASFYENLTKDFNFIF